MGSGHGGLGLGLSPSKSARLRWVGSGGCSASSGPRPVWARGSALPVPSQPCPIWVPPPEQRGQPAKVIPSQARPTDGTKPTSLSAVYRGGNSALQVECGLQLRQGRCGQGRHWADPFSPCPASWACGLHSPWLADGSWSNLGHRLRFLPWPDPRRTKLFLLDLGTRWGFRGRQGGPACHSCLGFCHSLRTLVWPLSRGQSEGFEAAPSNP